MPENIFGDWEMDLTKAYSRIKYWKSLYFKSNSACRAFIQIRHYYPDSSRPQLDKSWLELQREGHPLEQHRITPEAHDTLGRGIEPHIYYKSCIEFRTIEEFNPNKKPMKTETKTKAVIADPQQYKLIPLIDIALSKTNPRKSFDEDAIKELSLSIKEIGVIQPAVIRINGKPGKYELVCGERRYWASMLLGKDNTLPCIIRELTDEQALDLQITENLQRKDIHPMEEAAAFKALMNQKAWSIEEIAKRVGKSTHYVARILKLNDLSPVVQKAFFQNRLKMVDVIRLFKLSPKDQEDYFKNAGSSGEIKLDDWRLRQYTRELDNAPFNTKYPNLKKDVGACITCQFNTASNTLLFPDEKKGICTNAKCFQSKCDIAFDIKVKEAVEDPELVIYAANGSNVKSDPVFVKLKADGVKVYQEYNDCDEEYHADKKQIASGKVLKAFVIYGHNKGKNIWIRPRLKEKSSAADIKSKAKSGNISATDVKNGIESIRINAKRKHEIEKEKMSVVLYEAFCKDKTFNGREESLFKEELVGFILAACQLIGYHRSHINKVVGSSGGYPWTGMYKVMMAKTQAQLQKLAYAVSRCMILEVIDPKQGSSPDANGMVAVLFDLVKEYDLELMKKELAERKETLDKYDERVDKRIADLKAQLKPAKDPAAAKPKGKGLQALLTDAPAKKKKGGGGVGEQIKEVKEAFS